MTKRKTKPAPQPAEQQIPIVVLPPVRADVYEAAKLLIDHGRKSAPMNSQAQTAVLAVTQWVEAVQQYQPPSAPPAPPADGAAVAPAAHDTPAEAAPGVPMNRAARRATARRK